MPINHTSFFKKDMRRICMKKKKIISFTAAVILMFSALLTVYASEISSNFPIRWNIVSSGKYTMQ